MRKIIIATSLILSVQLTAKNNDKSAQAQNVSVQTIQGETVANLPPHLLKESFRLSGDFLYWRSSLDGTQYAINGASSLLSQ